MKPTSQATTTSSAFNSNIPLSKTLSISVCLGLTSVLLSTSNTKTIATEKSPDVTTNATVTELEQPYTKDFLAEYVKPAVVRIAVRCEGKIYYPKKGKIYDVSTVASLGSGAFVSENGNIITNKHVEVATQDKDLCQHSIYKKLIEQVSEQSENKDRFEDSLDLIINSEQLKVVNIKLTPLVILPNGEEMPFKTIVSGAPVGEGKDVALIKINVRNAPVLELANSNEVKLAEYVMALGYPMSGNSDYLNPKSSNVVSITDGIVSAKKNLKDGLSVIQVSAPAYYGSSGGSVVNSRGQMIGMVTFGGNDAVSGFTFILPSNTIMEFVEQAKVKNQESFVNQKYRQGLQLYNQGKYQQAMQKFQLVKRLFPYHSEVEQFIKACQKEIALSEKN